jgi:membrane protein implicated in regulation of membrane protease activity
MSLLVAIVVALVWLEPPWSWLLVAGATLVEVGEAWFWLRWNRRRRAVVGAESLVGREAVVVTPTQVKLDGELWRARSDEPLVAGERVRVEGLEGLTLLVLQKHKES